MRKSVLARLLPVAILGVASLGALSGFAWRKSVLATREADALVSFEQTEPLAPRAMLDAADRALEVSPRSKAAHAWRALALARLGRLDEADGEIELAGACANAERALAWVEFRRGLIDEARERLAKLREFSDEYWLLQPSSVSRLVPTIRPYFESMRFPRFPSADPSPYEEGTIEAHAEHLLRARRATFALDDERAAREIAIARRAPPHELAQANALEPELAKIREGSDGEGAARSPNVDFMEPFDRAVLEDATARAKLELARDRIVGDPRALDRAVERLRRALFASPGDTTLADLLARALARRLPETKDRLTVIAKRLASSTNHPAAARVYLALGDEDAARAAMASDTSNDVLALALRPVLAHDQAACARVLGLKTASDDELAACERVLRAIVLERPWSELESFERLFKNARSLWAFDLAEARVRTDPIAALVAYEDGVKGGHEDAPLLTLIKTQIERRAP